MKKGYICWRLFNSLILIFISSLLLACSPDHGQEAVDADAQMISPGSSGVDLIIGGRLEEARASGEAVAQIETGKDTPKKWEEQLDGGDAPLIPGCACGNQLANCGGAVVRRTVDECFPRDDNGKNVILQEKTVPADCGHYGKKEYNCEKLLGEGAECRLINLDCCGVSTTSGYCFINVES